MKHALIAILVLAILVAGCGVNTGPNYQRKYYQGYDSLDMKFLDGSPPITFYYDSEGIDNEIPIVVQVENKGASDAYGALFIHGFDPNFVEIAGGKLPGRDGGTLSYSNGHLNIGGIYIGLSGRNNNYKGDIGFIKDGNYYGGSVFTRDGKFVGLDVTIAAGSNRIGSRLADPVFQMLTNHWGWNSIIALEGDTPETPGGGLEVY